MSMLKRLGKVFEKEKDRLKEAAAKIKLGQPKANSEERARQRKAAVDQLRASYKALLKVKLEIELICENLSLLFSTIFFMCLSAIGAFRRCCTSVETRSDVHCGQPAL